MRVYIQIPDILIATLQDQARAAHRPPRFHLEWLIQQALTEPPTPRTEEPRPQSEAMLCAAAETAT